MPQPKHIVRIPLPEIEELDQVTQKYFKICEEKLGMVPNVLRAFSGNLEKFHAFTAYYNKLMLDEVNCNLKLLEREMIAVVVSSANRCYYCLVAHGQAVREISGDPELGEMLAINYRVADLEARQRAMLDFAYKMTVSPSLIDDADRENLRNIGFSDEEIFDIADTAGFYNMSNRVATAVDMMPNPEYHNRNR